MRAARLDRGLWRANKKAAGRVCALCILIERLCGLAQRQMYCIGVECFARRGFLIEMLESRRGGINSSFVAGDFEAVAAVRNLNPRDDSLSAAGVRRDVRRGWRGERRYRARVRCGC